MKIMINEEQLRQNSWKSSDEDKAWTLTTSQGAEGEPVGALHDLHQHTTLLRTLHCLDVRQLPSDDLHVLLWCDGLKVTVHYLPAWPRQHSHRSGDVVVISLSKCKWYKCVQKLYIVWT